MKTKAILGLLLSLCISSCSNLHQENNQNPITEARPVATTDTLGYDNIQGIAKENKEAEDCIFDQTTQTDKFLKDVKELSGYNWDYTSRTATHILAPGDTLLITRGGCDHFTVSAEFRLRNDQTDYSNWGNVYTKCLWIAKILGKEFHYEELKKDIDLNRVTIEHNDYAEVATFDNTFLVDNAYEIERKVYPNSTVIKLSRTTY